jgi:hypothetical protein
MDALGESVVVRKECDEIHPAKGNDKVNTATSSVGEANYISVISQDSDRLSQDTTLMDAIEEDLSDTKREASPNAKVSSIECPRPNDVLMPMEGYRMWSGNVFLKSLIRKKRLAFLQTSTKEQAVTLIDIVQDIQQKRLGRFLMAIQKPLSPLQLSDENLLPAGLDRSDLLSVTVWQVMDETDVLMQVAKLLRAKAVDEGDDVDKRLRKKERKRRRRERRALRKQRASGASAANSTAQSSAPGTEEDLFHKQIPPAYMDILQGLYYVPSYYPLGDSRSLRDNEDSDSYSSSEISTSSEDGTAAGPRVAKKRGKNVDLSGAGSSKNKISNDHDLKPSPIKDLSEPVSFHYKPKPVKSLQAVMEEEGSHADLPKGVTIRPSGKWVRTHGQIESQKESSCLTVIF